MGEEEGRRDLLVRSVKVSVSASKSPMMYSSGANGEMSSTHVEPLTWIMLGHSKKNLGTGLGSLLE